MKSQFSFRFANLLMTNVNFGSYRKFGTAGVMALALYAQASYGEVLRCLLEGIRWLRLGGAELALATKSSITKARRRLGPAPLAELYRRVARPLAEPGLPECFYRGLRLVSLDGTTLDLPDTPELETRF